jgi:hypothetical protein
VNSNVSTSREIAWVPWIIVAVGGLLFLIGAGRFVLGHRFDFIDALYCLLAMVPAWLLLLVFAYVLDHPRLVSVVPLFVAGLLVFSSPVFDVALGLAMMGAAGPALKEWKDEEDLRKSTTVLGGENRGGK